jgi:cysteine-rich repeat protein
MMRTPRSIFSVIALPAIALSLAVCATPPDLRSLKSCGDGTFCPIETACYATAECLKCGAVADPKDWMMCGELLCPVEVGCDPGNPACMDNCRGAEPSGCGDGVKAGGNGGTNTGEECDDGNLIDGDGCDHNCKLTGCGNGVRTTGEECDDGNLIDGDGCDHECRRESASEEDSAPSP